MSERRAIAHPPSGTGGRRVRINDQLPAYSLHGRTVLLHAGLTGHGEPDAVEWARTERAWGH